MKLQYQLPPLYQKLLPAELLSLDPVETKATCDACAMTKERHRGKSPYREDLKCCTFHPWLPNFAVGALLLEPNSPSILREKIATREYSLPIGLVPPIRYQVEFNSRNEKDFGQREDWLCPYYDRQKNLCGVWRHRGSVCVSFYCKSDQGKDGKRFWKSLENFLSFMEMALMEEALVQLDFSPRQVSDMLGMMNRFGGTVQELRGWTIPEKKARLLWNGYFDDQEGFFKKSLAIVNSLNPSTFRDSLGESGCFLLETALADARCFR